MLSLKMNFTWQLLENGFFLCSSYIAIILLKTKNSADHSGVKLYSPETILNYNFYAAVKLKFR